MWSWSKSSQVSPSPNIACVLWNCSISTLAWQSPKGWEWGWGVGDSVFYCFSIFKFGFLSLSLDLLAPRGDKLELLMSKPGNSVDSVNLGKNLEMGKWSQCITSCAHEGGGEDKHIELLLNRHRIVQGQVERSLRWHGLVFGGRGFGTEWALMSLYPFFC